MKVYRVECNFGCKYFRDKNEAYRYFENCKNKCCNVGIWIMTISKSVIREKVLVTQKLLDYSFTHFPNF